MKAGKAIEVAVDITDLTTDCLAWRCARMT